MPDYSEWKIKDHQYWTLFLHGESQRYLGHSYAWLRRSVRMQRLSDLTHEELYELWKFILPQYERALDRLWCPGLINCAWLGNEFHVHGGHGHMHLIPRYESSVPFAGLEFRDDEWGKHYEPYPKLKLPQSTLFTIRDALRKELA